MQKHVSTNKKLVAKELSGAYFGRTSRFKPLFYCARTAIPVFILLLVLLSACRKQERDVQGEPSAVKTEDLILDTDEAFQNAYKDYIQTGDNNESSARRRFSSHGFSFITFLQLLEARAATAKYRDFDKAIADGYADINVVVPNMGFHFMKSAIVDAKFEVRKPEILVYNKRFDGRFELVAVEYAVPISETPDKAPEGFDGSADVWERNTGFGLWLQHAWIWRFNPDGVFNDTNPLIHVNM